MSTTGWQELFFNTPQSVELDPSMRIYIVDQHDHQLTRISNIAGGQPVMFGTTLYTSFPALGSGTFKYKMKE